MKVVYVAGRYSGKDRNEVSENIALARKYAIEIWRIGHVALCPHLNTAHFDDDIVLSAEEYYKRDLKMLERCDVIFMLPNWQQSTGAKIELEFARANDIPAIFDLAELKSPIPFTTKDCNE